MDFELQWLLIGLPVSFALGWMASRLDLRQVRRDASKSPKAYFKGLNLLLNEQPDKAIDAFIEAVQADPDTAELHFALGNLFRRRGEFERAVRVHEHLLHRGDLKPAERQQAQAALALDYMKAGLFDRAEQAYGALLGGPHDLDARMALMSLHERSRDWRSAAQLAAGMGQPGGDAAFARRASHHHCELAEEANARGEHALAERELAQAAELAPEAPRPIMLAGQLARLRGDHALACAQWERLPASHPAEFVLIALDYAACSAQASNVAAARSLLQGLFARHPAPELQHALDALNGSPDATAWLNLLDQQPSLSGALGLLAIPASQWPAQAQETLLRTVRKQASPLQRYRCAACGFEAQRHFWQCPGCLNWDAYPALRLEQQ